jgi:hypothetical protein
MTINRAMMTVCYCFLLLSHMQISDTANQSGCVNLKLFPGNGFETQTILDCKTSTSLRE